MRIPVSLNGVSADAHDEWDYDAINEMILANQEMRKVWCISIATASATTIDRTTGERWSRKI